MERWVENFRDHLEQQQEEEDLENEPPIAEDPTSFSNERLDFAIDLQELRSIKSQLHSAAQFCEAAYLSTKDQKQAILENLKVYSVKALVNSVDHIGTVAFKINEALSQCTDQLSALDIKVTCFSQHVRTCHETACFESLLDCQGFKRRPLYGKHYSLAEENVPGNVQKKYVLQARLSNMSEESVEIDSSRSLSWHSSPDASTRVSRLASPVHEEAGFFSRTMSSRRYSKLNSLSKVHDQVLLIGPPKSLSPILSLHDNSQHDTKNLLSSILGRSKSGKPRRVVPLDKTWRPQMSTATSMSSQPDEKELDSLVSLF